ncbi:MAG: protein kinase [Chloroflexi bacterium]|nr:protein kinase [Chloroflexota bacterium]MDL1883971.1 serine/threonine-protein kinase [Anaerolineae bacterium CFX8]
MPDTTKFAATDNDNSGESSLQANIVLMKRYKILGVVGGGGMGTVYQARDLNFPDVRKIVAVKEMINPNTDPALHNSTLKTFQREANILATLNHPAIPKIFDFFDQNDRVYLVMEYINGNDLEALLTKTKELPIEKIIDWAIELCDVISYLHTQPKPIVFRDLKPSNIMVDSFGKIRLIDFGIAKIFDSGVKKHTMIGTEGYCAPEQYRGDVTILSDIYSLGATLHHVLTRQDPRLAPPFSFPERPISQHNPKAPDALVAIVEKALAFEPANRFQSCAEMKSELEKMRLQPQVVISGVKGTGLAGTDFFAGVEASGTIEPKWKFLTEDEIRSSAVVHRDFVFVGSYDTNVWAVNLSTGAFVWKYPTHGGIAASPAVDDSNKLVLFGSEDNTFYAVDYRNGRINWSYTTQDKIRSTARIATEVDAVFFGSDDGHLYALASPNGRFLWKFQTGEAVRSRPVITNEVIIFGAESGEIFALGLDGKRKWSYRTRRPVTSSPFVDKVEGICYVGSSDNNVYALDASSGYSSWRFRTNGPVISSPVVEEDLLFFGSADGHLYAINAQTSREKWKFATDKPIISSPVVHQGAVYFGGTDEYLYCVDMQTGKERWKFKTNGAITSTPCIANDVIIFGSFDKTLYALPLVN